MNAVAQLTDWVAGKHAGQIIRRTTAPYLNHLLEVANLAKSAAFLGYEIGLCHDLLEDTDTTAEDLTDALLSFGYTQQEAGHITACVEELTDVFTAAAFPQMRKKKRKKRESKRLTAISPDAQTVKYADLIYNIGWVLAYDCKHAKRYLQKKMQLLARLNRGDAALRQQAIDLIGSYFLP